MLVVDNVTKSFGSVQVLTHVSLQVQKGQVVVLIGASGSGKSTLLQCINALEPIQGGNIVLDGVDVHAATTNLNELRQHIGIVFQQYNLFPHLRAVENIMLAPRLVLRLSREEARRRAELQLAHVGLADKADAYPSQLSGGQQQRVAIARALAMAPQYLLLDEITAALDPELVDEVLDTLCMLKQEGMTMVVVTHEMSFAHDIADRVLFLDGGQVCEEGPPAKIFGSPQQERTRGFLARYLRHPYPPAHVPTQGCSALYSSRGGPR